MNYHLQPPKADKKCGLTWDAITRDLLIGSSSFLRRSIALDLSYRSAQKRAQTALNRPQRRRKTIEHAKSAPKAPKNRTFSTHFLQKNLWCQLYRLTTRDLLIDRNSFLRGSRALNLSYKSAKKKGSCLHRSIVLNLTYKSAENLGNFCADRWP